MRSYVFGEGDGAPRRIDVLASRNRRPFKKRGAKWEKALAWAVTAWTLGMAPVVYAHPILDAKDAAVSISGTTNMTITSGAANNLIKWVDFSIGKNESVNFNDTNNYLNYVTGSARSDILGTLTGGGHIWLVNPNGILIHEGATVNVGNLHLSTRTLTDDVLNSFVPDGEHSLAGDIGGDVINMGTLNATTISVEGNNITFKNRQDIKNTSGTPHYGYNKKTGYYNVNLTATGEIHLGHPDPDHSSYKYNTNKTPIDYKLITTADGLKNIQNNLADNYMLGQDVTTAAGFTPISEFTGKFDGLNHTVTMPSVSAHVDVNDNAYIGLFGKIGSGAVVENVGVATDWTLTSDNGDVFAGSVAGYNRGTLRNVWHSGKIDVTAEESSNLYVGGVVGYNSGAVGNARNMGAISATAKEAAGFAGGIVGYNYGSSTIENAYNIGAVTGKMTGGGDAYVGGIAGSNTASTGQSPVIRNVYNLGSIAGNGTKSYAGGIVGSNASTSNDGTNIFNATIENAYHAQGSITGTTTGAIAGRNRRQVYTSQGYKDVDGVITNAFYSATDKNGTALNDSNATEKTEADLKTAATFADWSIAKTGGAGKVWRIYEDSTRPLLTAFLTTKDEASSKVYDGTADVGKTVTSSTQTSTQEQGIDWAKKISVITPKDLTVTGSIDKTYDGTNTATLTAANLSGVVDVDKTKLTVATTTAAYDDKNAGEDKTVTYTGLTLGGAKAGNYSIVADGTGTGDISKANITISTDDVTKTYDGTTSAAGAAAKVTSGTLFTGDSISGGTFAFTDKNAGTGKTVTVSGVTVSDGNSGGNYNVTYAANTASTINRREAYVNFGSTTKTYDGTTSATPGTATFLNLVEADRGKVGVTADAAYEDQNVGTGKKVKYTNVTLTGTENYYLSETSFDVLTGTITRKALELVATPQTITEGEATPTTWSGNLTGFVAGERLGANDVYFFALDNPAASAAGSYSVTGTLSIDGGEAKTSGDYGDNYTFANAAANATAFTIAAYVPPAPEPTPTPKPQDIVETVTENPGAAKEYTDVVASLDSGANTVLPTTNVLPTQSVVPTNSVLPTGNDRPTGNTQQTGSNQPTGNTQQTGSNQTTEPAAQESTSASGEQNETQEQNGLLPAQQTTGGQPAAGRQETQLGLTYTDINMPESMSVEALAATMNGETTQQSGAPAASNTPATEPTTQNASTTEPTTAVPGTSEANNEEE